MKTLSLERTPKRVELLKRMVDKNPAIAAEAKEAFAAFLSPVVQTVLNQKTTSAGIYQDAEFTENDRPTIPLDLYLGTQENHIRVWAQTLPGGLATNMVTGLQEYPFIVYELDSAIAFLDLYLKNARLDVLTAGMQRMINEIAIKQDRNAWTPLLTAAAQANTPGFGAHIIESTIPAQFMLHDMNRMATFLTRMYTSYAGGTPDSATPAGLTDLFVSPEVLEDIRAFAYNPLNVRGGYKSDKTESSQGNVPLPDAIRTQIYNSGGLTEIYNVTIHSLVEFGVGRKYNTVFDGMYSGTFDPALDEVLIGLDLSRPVFIRPVLVDDETGGQVLVRPDDQFVRRSEKTGFYAKVKEGRVILDDRAIAALIIKAS